jgi:hypothetical protein
MIMDNPLPGAIDDFKNILSDEQRSELHGTTAVPGPDAILVFIVQLDATNKFKKGKSIASRLYSVLVSVRDFCSIIDVFVLSHPEIVALVWAASG